MNKSLAPVAFVALLACASAHADVTIQEQTNLDIASIKAHGASTRRITSDKERTEAEFRCDGFMSMLCGKNDSLEIVRLDRDLIMTADTKKKTYIEKPFPTPEQRRVLEEHMQAVIEKMKSCPTPVPSAPASVDTAKCQMTPPTTSVVNAGDTATIAGHGAHHSILTMTQSCANKDTGDSCDMAYTFDVWLANDDVPELADRRTFDQNFAHKLGLDDVGGMAAPAQLSQFLAPYKDAMKKLGTESSSLKGYPLKTTFRFSLGGPHCASAPAGGASKGGSAGGGGSSSGVLAAASGAAVGAASSSTEGAADSKTSGAIANAAGDSVGGSIAGSAAGAFASKLIGGIFSKKKQADAQPAPKESGAAETPVKGGLVTIAEFTVETTSIGSGAIPGDQFEMPGDFKKIVPQEKALPETPSCPKTGG